MAAQVVAAIDWEHRTINGISPAAGHTGHLNGNHNRTCGSGISGFVPGATGRASGCMITTHSGMPVTIPNNSALSGIFIQNHVTVVAPLIASAMRGGARVGVKVVGHGG